MHTENRTDWLHQIDLEMPFWADCLSFLKKLEGPDFPDCNGLNALLPEGLTSHGGQAVRFIPSTELTEAPYEYRIYTSGRVSTRQGSWHDLFNALIWMRFPHIKTAMNALHFSVLEGAPAASRGLLRDAITLFDECGVIVFASAAGPLDALSERRWNELFQSPDIIWRRDIQLTITGHAMLEKYLAPYKSMTAKALLVKTDKAFMKLPRNQQIKLLDRTLARRMLAGKTLDRPSCLTPLPMAGIPGWWPGGPQDQAFYADHQVFRPAPENLKPVSLIQLD